MIPTTQTAVPYSPSDRVAELAEIADRQNLVALRGIKLSPSERQILALLLKRNRVHREVAWTVLMSNRPEVDRTDVKLVDVYVSKLRHKLAHVATLKTDSPNGWYFEREDKERLMALVNTEDDEAIEPDKPKRGRPVSKPPGQIAIGAIEKGVPIPVSFGRNRPSPFPLADMVPGDSFWVRNITSVKMRAVIHHFRRRGKGSEERTSWKFLVRQIEDDLVRVWRIE